MPGVSVLPYVVEAELEVLDAADPFGAVDDTAFSRRKDFGARQGHDGHARLFEHVRADAVDTELDALEIFPALDGLLEPAQRLRRGCQDGEADHVQRSTSWYHSFISSRPPPSQIQPNMSMVSMPKSGPWESGTASPVLADIVAGGGMAAVDDAARCRIEHLERAHYGACRERVNFQAAA